jgi:hypothetical protein
MNANEASESEYRAAACAVAPEISEIIRPTAPNGRYSRRSWHRRSRPAALPLRDLPAGEFAILAGLPDYQLIPGDFNGDRLSDLALVKHTPDGHTVPVALTQLNGFAIQYRTVGEFAAWAATAGVQVVTGDFDTIEGTDIALVRRTPGWSTIPVALARSDGFSVENRPAGEFAVSATTPGTDLVVGDFNGDRVTDLGLLRRVPGWNTMPVALSPPPEL